MAGERHFGGARYSGPDEQGARNDEDYGPNTPSYRNRFGGGRYHRDEPRSFGPSSGDDYGQAFDAYARSRRGEYPDYSSDYDRLGGEPDYGMSRRFSEDRSQRADAERYRRERFDTDERTGPGGYYGARGRYYENQRFGGGENPTLQHQAEGKTDHETGPHRGRGPKNYVRSDERIRDDVSDRLADDALLDATEIDVAVSKGEVTLSGTVETRWAKRRAEDLADQASGVKHVQNNLRVHDTSAEARAIGSNVAVGPTRAI